MIDYATSEMETFDPRDPALTIAQDVIGEEYGWWPDVRRHWDRVRPDVSAFEAVVRCLYAPETIAWRCGLTDGDFGPYIRALRQAGKLPLTDEYLSAIRGVLAMAERELRERVARRERVADARRRGDDGWEDADLAAEVEAIAGEGRHAGGDEWWFRCPLHTGDRSASLHVNARKRLWHCFGCQRQGGVYEWRRAVKAA